MARAAQEAAARGIDAVVVAPSPDLFYLTGYAPMPMERPTFLILRPGLPPSMLVPELEFSLATAATSGDGVELMTWSDGKDPYGAASDILPADGVIAAGDRMWAAHLLGLQRAVPDASFQPGSPLLGALRSVKDAGEIDALTRAGAAADETFRQICEAGLLGKSERQIAAEISDLLVTNGHDRPDFAIVASGPNSASPHHEAGDRVVQRGDAILLDFGGAVSSYYSDTSRTVVTGEAPDGFDEVYEAVRRAQEAAFLAVKPGAAAQEIDRVARSVIAEAGFAEGFIHRTGHGIGLEVHETPYLVEGNADALLAGMTFSIEPGIYLPGRFGVRIEDIVLATEGGAERLNRSERGLLTVA
jgi:Xaa-Pro aminopeptidase